MDFTVSQLEAVALTRQKGRIARLAEQHPDGAIDTRSDGNNPDLAEPLWSAAVDEGIAPAAYPLADADLAGIEAATWRRLCERANLHALRLIRGRWATVDTTTPGVTQAWGQMLAGIDADIARAEATVKSAAAARGAGGFLGGTLTAVSPLSYPGRVPPDPTTDA